MTQTINAVPGFLLRAGSWGDYDEPSLVEARAEFSNTTLSQHSAHGPSFGDSLILTFDLDLDTTIPAYTRAQVDALVEFIPPFDDIDYVGNWTARNQLTVTFVTHADAKTYFEDHLRGRFAVGKMAVRMRSTSPLRVRDRSSPFMRSQQYVTLAAMHHINAALNALVSFLVRDATPPHCFVAGLLQLQDHGETSPATCTSHSMTGTH